MNQTDFVTTNKRFKNAALHCKTYPSTDCRNNHLPVVYYIRVKLRKFNETKAALKLQYDSFPKDPTAKEIYKT